MRNILSAAECNSGQFFAAAARTEDIESCSRERGEYLDRENLNVKKIYKKVKKHKDVGIE